ncbi:hypothetical protein ACHWQZ_G011986 [Mnemiopsis leidyi]
MLVLVLLNACLIKSVVVAQDQGEDFDIPVTPGLYVAEVLTAELDLEKKKEILAGGIDENQQLADIKKRGDCSREGRICGMHKNWGRCVDKFIQDQCPCTCTSSTPTDNNRSNSGRDYNRYNGSGETESTNDSRNGLGISVEEKTLLDEHNKRRRHHGVPDLIYDTKLAASSLSWCKVLARQDKFEHSKQDNSVEGVGENLYVSWGMNPNQVPESAVKNWYDEIKDHDFYYPKFKFETGHFTQVIWKATTRVGCGVTKPSESSSPKRKSYVCCHYSPPGNWRGKFRENVPRPSNGVKYP